MSSVIGALGASTAPAAVRGLAGGRLMTIAAPAGGGDPGQLGALGEPQPVVTKVRVKARATGRARTTTDLAPVGDVRTLISPS
jgi:hypothetical protein